MSNRDELGDIIEAFEAELEGLERQRCQKNAPLSHTQWDHCMLALRSYFFNEVAEPTRVINRRVYHRESV